MPMAMPESPPSEEDRLYSAYTASLEQEQAAAATYELAVVDVKDSLSEADDDRRMP